MELDEMREKWAQYDAKLEASLQINRQLLKATQMNRTRSSLHRVALGLGVEAILNVPAIGMLGSFIYEHRTMARFVVPAVVLEGFLLVILNVLIRQLALALTIDYNKPLTSIQKQVEMLRRLHIRCTQWTLILSPLAWTPLLIVAMQGFWGKDAYTLLGTKYLATNLLFGVIFVLIALWLSKRYAHSMAHSPLVQGLMRVLAGHTLSEASSYLSTLSDFESESRL
ncbi:MAG: hypothetical protein NT023_09135 [Armatimonadetes bacterium]|nr:hypothetical protein [Armatimonadota bacterium]